MYLPFIRARRFDLLAIRDISTLITAAPNILPIIEPVNRVLSDVQNFCVDFSSNNKPFIIIANPRVGQADPREIDSEIFNATLSSYNNYVIGYQITATTTYQEITNLLRKYSTKKIAFLHYYEFANLPRLQTLFAGYTNIEYHIFIDGYVNRDYKDNFTGTKIIVKDCMNKRNNSDYPREEFYSDLPRTYASGGYNGFGDFLIESLQFSTGFRPFAVAIHLTFEKNNDIWINHFVSDSNTTRDDTAGKFQEALNKLVAENRSHSNKFNPYSTAVTEYRRLHSIRHFPQLGPAKRYSMRHHIELINYAF